MNWEKNIFSYILWLVYTVGIVAGMAIVFGAGFRTLGYSQGFGLLATAVVCLGAGLLVLFLHKRAASGQEAEGEIHRFAAFMGNTVLVIEVISCIVLFVVGIVLRAGLISGTTMTASDMVYFETAKVAEGNVIPRTAHGANYIYLKILHIIFLLFGNRFVATLWLNVVLLYIGGAFLYFAVRKLAGRVPALVMTTFLMLSPYMLEKTMQLSPEFLFLLIYSVVLWVIGGTLPKSDSNPFLYVAVGCLIGICCYLDVVGLTLLVFVAGIFTVERDWPDETWNQPGYVFLLHFLGTIAGWCLSIVLQAVLGSKDILRVLIEWLQLFGPDGFGIWSEAYSLPEYMNASAVWGNAVVLYGLLVLGIFTFWKKKDCEYQGIWVGTAAVLLTMQCFRIPTIQLTGVTNLYLCLAVLAGIGVSDILAVYSSDEEAIHEKEGIFNKKGKVKAHMNENNETKAESKVKYLDNPLPVPKKHQARVMDYQIKDEDDFDFKVKDDDDFDC